MLDRPLPPPAHIGVKRWERVKEAFRDGGYVSITEAAAYLQIDPEQIEAAIQEERLLFTLRFRKQYERKLIQAYDVDQLFGTRPKTQTEESDDNE